MKVFFPPFCIRKKKKKLCRHADLAKILPDALAVIVGNYIFCQKCKNAAEDGSHLCKRCSNFGWCLYEFSNVFPQTRLLLPAQSRQLGMPTLYRLGKPKKGFVRFECALYEAFFQRYRNPFLMSSVNRFPIVQTRCHREKYFFDHETHVKNLTFVYYCRASLLSASILIFPRHRAGLVRASQIFAWSFATASLYSLYKIYKIDTR